MYAATAGDGLYTSADGGKSWQPAANPVPDNLVTALAWSADGTELLVGTQRGVYSLEKGTWTSLAPGWDDYITGLISLYEGDTEQAYAGTLGDGVWRMSIGSRPATPTPAASPTAPPTPTATAASTPTTRPGHRLSPHVYVSPSSPVAGSAAVVSVRGPGKGTVTVALALGGWKRLFRGRIATDGWAAFGFVPPAGKLVITVTVRSVTQSATVRLSVTVRPKGSHRPR
jgi:hypothetical protein